MGDENPIRTLGDYSRPSHEGYRNTIELPDGNNVGKDAPAFILIFPVRDQAINGLNTSYFPSDPTPRWEDSYYLLRSIAQIFPPQGRLQNFKDIPTTLKVNLISEAWTLQGTYSKKSPIMASIFGSNPNLYDHISHRARESSPKRLMEVHLAPKSSVQVNKIASSCEICSGPHDTQYCMENLEQAFVDYASSHSNEVGEDEPEEEEIMEPNAAKGDDHSITVRTEEVEEESEESNEETEEEEEDDPE
ncbi:hypothetical protein Tco_0948275 [Tanacetum coccineum]